ncbi:MAG: phosphoenolpyruvate--protein phosphotransferase [Spirochaetales bacterium]|jgi:phosphotransferase system enzyme I (PtsI)|nr:phosphoenolpyruvate--protein phosphotransferase [Spirochaetales bacterium]
MVEIRGISASPGIVWGRAFIYIDNNSPVPKYDIRPAWVENEKRRLAGAYEKAVAEVEGLKCQTRGFIQSGEILDAHAALLRDPEVRSEIEGRLERELLNVDWIAQETFRAYGERLGESGDDYLRERVTDIHDVGQRLLSHLMHVNKVSLSSIREKVILVGRDLMPSEAVEMNPDIILGLAMEKGGRTSHTAILARTFRIPAVLGLPRFVQNVRPGDEILVDGNKGLVIINPDESTRSVYDQSRQVWLRRGEALSQFTGLPSRTRDGVEVPLMGNIEVPDDAEKLSMYGASGIGLYRSEFLFLQSRRLPAEDVQMRAYAQVLEAMGGLEVTIRTLDLGGDKINAELSDLAEENPLLGWRAIRFCLSRRDIFKTQLRALYRASVSGRLKIMFPMISCIEEFEDALELAAEVRDELGREGRPFENVPVGCMIEMPAAAAAADILAQKAAFFSIGTNDLIQYTLAVDRGNQRVAYLYDYFQPAVLRFIQNTIAAAHAGGIRVCMCGEMAGDPLAALVLLGLGLDEFSMNGSAIPEVKRIVRSVSLPDAASFAGEALAMRSGREIGKFVRDYMERHFDLSVY